MWVAVSDLPQSVSHPFYETLNRLLAAQACDDFVETQGRPFSADTMGRPGLAPGIDFRLLLLGYVEGIDPERGIAWRAADALGVRALLGLALPEAAPDHSTISRTRRLIDRETHQAVFTWVLQCLGMADLVKGKTIAIDAPTLEANAALRSIVRRDIGESSQAFGIGLATASGIATPTRAELARLDRQRKKKGSNDDWTHPHDPDARITKMKDGRTHLAHKAEHAGDLETALPAAIEQLHAVAAMTDDVRTGEELVTDKGSHSKQTVLDVQTFGLRTYISEPDRGRQHWVDQHAARDAVYANRRRIHGDRGQPLMRRRGELLERPNAHLSNTGGMRRTPLRHHGNILKRLLVHAAAANLGLWMRTVTGVGTPRGLQGRLAAALALWMALWVLLRDRVTARRRRERDVRPLAIPSHRVAAMTCVM